ncbi:MAG: bifunctional DNA-formamidopyrimidine glycosylase/DNA-(apurinic or apyrimidinic site) lyase [Alphaproteobacteria bacterium]|nr:bifunctional DNA-formamidopyrimidine glycosylase/DNA-(apurinic or apyrimidinic site) lyase [Alphaproteobacteria bacterium]
MPELPEVETIKNTVSAAVNGAVIRDAIVNQPRLRELVPTDFAKRIRGAKIINLRRIAKYMLMDLDNGLTIIWHFGMSGKIRIEKANPPESEKHDHVIIETDKGVIYYNDARRFGLVLLGESDKLTQHPCFKHIGLDPWDTNLTPQYLLKALKKRKCAIKLSLLNQEIICGIGNIYASEILYRARILPERESCVISESEAKEIIKYTRIILEEAINAGGSTIHDYRRPDGDIGYFQQHHCVYNKTGQRCPDCKCNIAKTGGIRKIIQGGRSTFYCPNLQK